MIDDSHQRSFWVEGDVFFVFVPRQGTLFRRMKVYSSVGSAKKRESLIQGSKMHSDLLVSFYRELHIDAFIRGHTG